MLLNIIAVLVVLAFILLMLSHLYYAIYDLTHFEEYKKRALMEREVKLIVKQEMQNYTIQNKPVSATAAIYDSIYH